MTIEELFGTLQQSIVDVWRYHLETGKYSSHEALNDYYEDMPEEVDRLIEDYMGLYGKIKEYKSVINRSEHESPVDYLKALRKLTVDGKDELIDDDELDSDIDNVLSLIDTTLYKLKELKESECSSCDKGEKKKVKAKKHIKDYLKEEEE